MTESTGWLTATQAAARLGVKTSTLYSYVSRGLLPRHRAPDGRTSLFDPADLGRLERRASTRRAAPADVVVGSELTLVDPSEGRVWYRGLDVLRASRERRFEDIASWLWTGSFEGARTWHADARSLDAGSRAQAALDPDATAAQRLPLIAAAVAASRPDAMVGTAAGADVMASLVDCLPGPASRDARFAGRLLHKLTSRAPSSPMVDVLDAALSVSCEHGLTNAALIARLTVAGGGGVHAAVASAMGAEPPMTKRFVALETALATAARDGSFRALDELDGASIDAAFAPGSYRSGDPRASVVLAAIAELTPDEAEVMNALARELQQRSEGRPTLTFALAAVSWLSGMPAGSGAAVALVAHAAGWIAHAIEESLRPTPYRPRLAYTGQPPRDATPRRTLDAVRDYLARE